MPIRPTKIINNEIHYRCNECTEYFPKSFFHIGKNDKPYPKCKPCNNRVNSQRQRNERKDTNHIDLRGTTKQDRQEVIEVMKRAGFTTDKPFHIQFNERVLKKYGILLN